MLPELFERSPAAGATLTASAVAVLYVVYRVLCAVGRFLTWVTDNTDRIARACYALAGVLMIGGGTSIGFGASRINSAPEKPVTEQERRHKFMVSVLQQMSNTGNKDRLEALKVLAEAYDKQYKPATVTALVAAPEMEQTSSNHPPGAPLVAGGLGAIIVALATAIRTAAKYD